MRNLIRTGLVVTALLASSTVRADQGEPPILDCAMSFKAARTYASGLPGAATTTGLPGYDVISVGVDDVWRADYMFSLPDHSAHPAVALRIRRKQVTGVWTAESKVCGYGDKSQFVALMSAMRAEDVKLTNASREEVEKAKKAESPLAPSP